MSPRLSAVVVHWRDEDALLRLVGAWPEDPRFELLVVDNSATLGELPAPARCLPHAANLGFAGGVNRGLAAARGEWILILNPDVRPEPGALERLLDACDELGGEAFGGDGVVPALVGEDGTLQTSWQLRPLPSALALALQAFFLDTVRGPRQPPPRGTVIPQPAGAALALRREVLEAVGGLDEGYFPAWLEDVDLARRLDRGGHRLLYAPEARFRHVGGGSLPALGYGPFLWIYYRNLARYLRRHHGGGWALLVRLVLPATALARLVLLPLRRPTRARSRGAAARGLLALALGAASGWRRPRGLAERFASPRGRRRAGAA